MSAEQEQAQVPDAAPAPEPEKPATSSFGKYQLFAAIGSGGMAEVFLGVVPGPRGFNKLVVVKRLRAHLASESEDFVDMFLDEARLAARLNHPNIVHTYEVGEHDGALFIAMEYLDGQPLKRLRDRCTKQNTELPIPIVVRMVSDALAGLHHAHELRDYDGTPLAVVHRDISPHNIFVTYDGATKIVDFGIAKATLNSTHTATGTFKGKPGYMAPEQATDANFDRRADLFAMGVVLFELLTGTRLFPGDAVQALHKVIAGDIPRASTLCPAIDAALDGILAKSLQRKPAERYQTAEEMRQALEGWLRSRSHTVEAPDVARFVGDLFHDLRETLRKKIDAQMKMVAAQQSGSGISLAGITARASSSSPFIVPNGTPPRLDLDAISGAGSLQSGTGSQAMATPTPGPTSRRWMFAGAAALVLATVGATLLLRPQSPATAAPPPATPAVVLPNAPSGEPAAPERKLAYVTIVSEPPGASIAWAGRVVGKTPATIELAPGPQTLSLGKDGFESATIEVDVPSTPQQPLLRSVTLTPLAGARPAAAPFVQVGATRGAVAAPVAAPSAAPAPPPPAAPSPTAAPTPAAPTRPTVKILDDGKPKVRVVE